MTSDLLHYALYHPILVESSSGSHLERRPIFPFLPGEVMLLIQVLERAEERAVCPLFSRGDTQ